MNQYTRYEITFGEEGEDPRFAKVQSLQLSKRIKEEIVAIWPTGGVLYDSQIVIVSPDGLHTTILRSGAYETLKRLMQDGYRVVNGKYPRNL